MAAILEHEALVGRLEIVHGQGHGLLLGDDRRRQAIALLQPLAAELEKLVSTARACNLRAANLARLVSEHSGAHKERMTRIKKLVGREPLPGFADRE